MPLKKDVFNLYNLGWNSFQQLCLTITREILGQTVEAFLDSRDGGRDGAFTGTWRSAGSEDLSGNFVIQCKFTSRVNYLLRTNDLSDEAKKARRLVAAGLCDSYVLMTNAGLSGTRAEDVKAVFKDAGAKHVAVFGSTWMNQQILESKRLRMLVPRVYGLGDLSQILDERAYAQARAILESMREDLAKVVITSAYRKAVEAINSHSFVLLLGEPAAGKTTISYLLAMAALDQWNASTLKLDDPERIKEHWNPEEPSQFFLLDDAFGVTQYEEFLVHRWNHILPQIKAMLGSGAKIVMTSRDYIYNRARKDLKETACPLLNESQVVVDVHDLAADEKRQILYNHLKLGKQPKTFRAEIKPHLEGIASHQRFIPETARRLADPIFTRGLFVNEYYIGQFVERREPLLQETLQGLDIDSKAALALIYMRNGRLESPIELRSSEREALERLGGDLGGCVAALEALKDSLVVLTHPDGQSVWSFKHPTIGDAYAAILVQSPEHLSIFIQGSTPERIVEQVTCGDVGIERAVVVPKSLFPQMLTKLEDFTRSELYKSPRLSALGAKWHLHRFLSWRCTKEFLSLYLERNPNLIDQVPEPGPFLYVAPEMRLAERLQEFGLLPEKSRQKVVETVSNYALEGQNADALDDEGIRTLFTDDEFDNFVHKVRTDLVPRLDDVRLEWESSYSSGEPPEEHMQQLLEFFESLKQAFADDEITIRVIEHELWRTREWINENTQEESEIGPRKLGRVEQIEYPDNTRSIFDDIDANEDEDCV